jgi:hypothetical protein
MDVFDMVVAIVVVSCVAGVINNYIKLRRDRQEAPDAPAYDAELAGLRERIEVLEKIVTDDRYQLTGQLNDLER